MESHKSALEAAAVQIKESGEGGVDYIAGMKHFYYLQFIYNLDVAG